MGGYYENIRGEIVHYTCISCLYFRWCTETGEGYCYNTGCDVDADYDACDRFIRDDDY